MTLRNLLFAPIILSFLSFAQSISDNDADKIIGEYRMPNDLDIKIYKAKDGYQGKIIALNGFNEGQTKDINNPDKERRTDPLLGNIILTGLHFEKESKEWTGGRMYSPEKGMEVRFKVIKHNNQSITVVASKYLFSKTLDWERR
ncbi:MAG: DUF2147 domain-containing protein [Bacteroidota bacterium]|nr:DUF2147 domain-containing protein [Bacteroidota bacterium]